MHTRKCFLTVAAALGLGAGLAFAADSPPGAALTEDECRAIWNTAAGRSGYLGPDGATPYIDAFGEVDTNSDHKISNAEFKAGCQAGLVHKFQSQQ